MTQNVTMPSVTLMPGLVIRKLPLRQQQNRLFLRPISPQKRQRILQLRRQLILRLPRLIDQQLPQRPNLQTIRPRHQVLVNRPSQLQNQQMNRRPHQQLENLLLKLPHRRVSLHMPHLPRLLSLLLYLRPK